MINLISTLSKKELRAARRNVILRKYVFTALALVVVITGSYAVGYWMLATQEATYKQQLAEYEPQRATYSDTIKSATEYNKNLLIAKSILANELAFSSFTTTIAKTTPKFVIAGNISIQTKDIAKPLDLNFEAKSYQDTLTTKEAFENSPYFSDVKIRSITKMPNDPYPYEFILIVTFDKESFNRDQKAGAL